MSSESMAAPPDRPQHPTVSAGLEQHSSVFDEPWQRAWETIGYGLHRLSRADEHPAPDGPDRAAAAAAVDPDPGADLVGVAAAGGPRRAHR